jgi:hypothetical protein
MPGIFGPTYGDAAQANLRGNSAPVIDQTLGSVINNVVGSSSSFRYDAIGTGVKSTQQLPLDWSKFENHTFFNSAQAKTNVAFEKVINEKRDDELSVQWRRLWISCFSVTFMYFFP